MNDNNFLEQLRSAMQAFTPSNSTSQERLNRYQERVDRADTAGKVGSSISGAAGVSGAAIGGALGGIPGAIIGAALTSPAGGWGLAKSIGTASKEKEAARQELLEGNLQDRVEEIRSYKDKALADAGTSRDELLEQGKMMDDDGNIVDIDWGYYSTQPDDVVKRVLGYNGPAKVAYEMNGGDAAAVGQEDESSDTNKSLSQSGLERLAGEVILGLWDNGDARYNALTDAGYDYNAIQDLVNQAYANNNLHYYTDPVAHSKGWW